MQVGYSIDEGDTVRLTLSWTCASFFVVLIFFASRCLFALYPSHANLQESFWVNHYASKVLYTVDGWVERNMDSVPQSFSDTILSSKHSVGVAVKVLLF